MNPYQATCPYCGHIWLGHSRRHAIDYMLDHCRKTLNHPTVEPYLTTVSVVLYWDWRLGDDARKGEIEQLLRHAVPDARKTLRNIPLD